MKSSFKLLNRLLSLVIIFFISTFQYAFAETKDIWQQSKEIKTNVIQEENKPEQLPSTIFNIEKKIQQTYLLRTLLRQILKKKIEKLFLVFTIQKPQVSP